MHSRSPHARTTQLAVQIVCLITGLSCGLTASPIAAQTPPTQTNNSFETDKTSWTFVDSDCPRLTILGHETSSQSAHSGAKAEHIKVQASNGTHILFGVSIPPSSLIKELRPTVWIKADRPGIQFMARAVLPRTINPETGEPLRLQLRGEFYRTVGEWQQLALPDVERELQREVQRQRTVRNFALDTRETYIDLLVLNAYGGAGKTDLWIDDLAYDVFPAARTSLTSNRADNSPPDVSNPRASGPPRLPRGEEPISVRGDLLQFNGHPVSVRMIEHNGESFKLLEELGFNCVLLSAPPTRTQLDDALAAGIWLMAPPPFGEQGLAIGPEHAPVLAWVLGDQLVEREAPLIADLSRDMRRADAPVRRPLLVGVKSGFNHFRRHADILLVHRDVIGSQWELSDHGKWLREANRSGRVSSPMFASIQTQPTKAMLSQLAGLGAIAAAASAYVEPDQLRAQVYHAVAAGARGFCFRSRDPLDGTDDASRLRASTLQLLNLELQVLDPWIKGGVAEGEVKTDATDVSAAILSTERSRLLMLIRQSRGEQFTSNPQERAVPSLVTSAVSSSNSAYRITFATLQPLELSRVSGGFRMDIEHAEPTSLVLLTQNPRTMEHIGRMLQANGPEMAYLRFTITQLHMQRTVAVLERIAAVRTALSQTSQRLVDASQQLSRASQLLGSGDIDWANVHCNRAMRAIAQIRRSHWEQAAASFVTPTATPLCSSFGLLPEHYALAERIRASQWSGNALPAGDFEEIREVLNAGWKKEASSKSHRPLIELTLDDVWSGRRCLRLKSVSTEPSRTVSEQPAIRVTSAPVLARAGQLVRIHGWVKVQVESPGKGALTIFDSLGGRELGQQLSVSQGWREFTFYRAAPRDHTLLLQFELDGDADVRLDGVTIHLIDTRSH
ncbi:MAG: hypothetical protein QGG36_18665 [Pirellulaceae bacterium]|jgi:hypothetical protein|nr:hypothetical protein [Pirellulaceae bacterium]MDP7017835.1 hypothetical protein [Pirellulaceae bacterium]